MIKAESKVEQRLWMADRWTEAMIYIETQIEYAKQDCQKEEYLISNFYCDDSASGTIPFDEIVWCAW